MILYFISWAIAGLASAINAVAGRALAGDRLQRPIRYTCMAILALVLLYSLFLTPQCHTAALFLTALSGWCAGVFFIIAASGAVMMSSEKTDERKGGRIMCIVGLVILVMLTGTSYLITC